MAAKLTQDFRDQYVLLQKELIATLKQQQVTYQASGFSGKALRCLDRIRKIEAELRLIDPTYKSV